jgi:hypothetical protein
MKGKRRKQWLDYFEYLSDRMGLYDWRIYITGQTPQEQGQDENVLAHVECIFGKKVANVSLSDDWELTPPNLQREAAVHELVHCHFSQVDLFVNHTIYAIEHESQAARYDAHYNYLMEFGVDALAKVIAPNMSLPCELLPALGKPAKSKKGSAAIA